MVAGFGDDYIAQSPSGFGTELVFANEGNDTITVVLGDTVFAGQGNDLALIGNSPAIRCFSPDEGNDTFDGSLFSSQAVTVVGGNDSNDGSDSIITGTRADLVFGNGGNDTIRANEGGDTVIGGVGNDSRNAPATPPTSCSATKATIRCRLPRWTPMFGGQGNDQIVGGARGFAAHRRRG